MQNVTFSSSMIIPITNRNDGNMVDKFATLKCFEKIIDAGKIVPDQRYGFVLLKNEVENSMDYKYDLYVTEIKEK